MIHGIFFDDVARNKAFFIAWEEFGAFTRDNVDKFHAWAIDGLDLFFQDNVIVRNGTIKDCQVNIQGAVGNLLRHGIEWRNTTATSQGDDVFAITQWLDVELSIREMGF